MLSPKVLMLDEPSSALAPIIVADIYRALEILRADGMGLLVSEQDVGRSLRSVDTCLVMNGGRVVLSGPAGELDKDPRVARIVLGEASGADDCHPHVSDDEGTGPADGTGQRGEDLAEPVERVSDADLSSGSDGSTVARSQ
jgi:ABC-type multidrug transport system ATPase subunit